MTGPSTAQLVSLIQELLAWLDPDSGLVNRDARRVVMARAARLVAAAQAAEGVTANVIEGDHH